MTRLAQFAVFAAILALALIIHTAEAHETTARERFRALLWSEPAPMQQQDQTAIEMRRLRREMRQQAVDREWDHMMQMNELQRQRQDWNN